MDFSPIIAQLLSKFWYLVPLFTTLAVLRSAWFKGVFGEFLVNTSATLLLDADKYLLIKNVTLPTEDGTTQIDHIILSNFGVFVVETKNMKGWIFGSEHQKTWTQKIYKYSTKFQNPLHQNYKHVKTLQSLMNLSDDQMFSLVVFVGNSTFKTKMPENVTYAGGYIRYIKSKTKPVLSDAEVDSIERMIDDGRLLSSLKTNRAHVAHVKEIVSSKQSSNYKACPKCGSKMTLKIAKKGTNAGGEFWGCSEFPRCRGVLDAN